MFNKDFFPTPKEVVDIMLRHVDLRGKTVLEPSAGKGDIIDALKERGANVICCELNEDLATIAGSKAKLIAKDFLTVSSEQISHVDYIIMNPPFSADEQHINHAWDIAPDGCEIIALCNWQSIENDYSRSRRILKSTIDTYGNAVNLGDVFQTAERSTGVEIGFIRLVKPGSSNDFADFFTDEEDEIEKQENGLMSYNAVREVVQRYVNAVKLYDDVLENAVKMNSLTDGLGVKDLVFTCSQKDVPLSRSEFAKELQKKSWSWVINKMNLDKYSTRGLMQDINKFVEQQKSMKFTMKNIYLMLDAIVQTAGQRMDKALLEVFDNLTKHHDENRWNVEGWKTNSHYLVNKKFICPWISEVKWHGGLPGVKYDGRYTKDMEDFSKALCFITGVDYNTIVDLYNRCSGDFYLLRDGRAVRAKEFNRIQNQPEGDNNYYSYFKSEDSVKEFISNYPGLGFSYLKPPKWGEWFDWGFFEVKLFKKGTGHFKFKEENVWALFNQQIARIKGFPLPESIKKAA